MANARPPSGGQASDTPQVTLGYDFSQLRNAPNVARDIARATTREMSAVFKAAQAEQRVLLEQERQRTATMRAESQTRVQQGRAESVALQQQARAQAQAQIQEERRKTVALAEEQKRQTTAFKAELNERARAARANASLGQNVATFTGAAFGGPIGGLVGAVAGGSPYLAAGLAVSQGARFAVDASQTAVAYRRQREAAISLAGSQARLNSLIATYRDAAGGAVARTTALASVSELLAQKLVRTNSDLREFVEGVRGASIATGKDNEFIITRLQLELLNQTGLRLNEIGLGMAEVRQRTQELVAANQGLTSEAAYQQAVLGLLNEKYGEVARSVAGQAVGTERLVAAWADLRLELGQELEVNTNQAAGALADLLEWFMRVRAESKQFNDELNRLGAARAVQLGALPALLPSAANQSGNRPFSPYRQPGVDTFTDDQVAALRRREEGFEAISREFRLSRAAENRAYDRQVAQVERTYQKTSLREAQDFARQRLNAERKLALSILDVAQDSARERVKWAADVERTIAKERGKTAERLAEINAKYDKDAEKRLRDHRQRLEDAAANLDAVAVREEQQRFRDENQEAKAARDEQIADAKAALQAQIDDQREALQRRIDEQRDNDAQRIRDMQAAFEEQKAQEDVERAIRLTRQAEDHDEQLAELGRQHDDRLQQIRDQAADERAQFTEESNRFLEAVGIHNQQFLDEEQRKNDAVIARSAELLAAQRRALLLQSQPYIDRANPGLYMDPANPYPTTPAIPSSSVSNSSVNNSRTSSVVIQPGAIQIVTLPGMDEQVVGDLVLRKMAEFLEEYQQ